MKSSQVVFVFGCWVVFGRFDGSSPVELGDRGRFGVVMVGSMASASIIWITAISGGVSDVFVI